MRPILRKFALSAHITFSVGWLGAVAAFIVLAVAGLIAPDVQTVRAAYLAMELTTWFVIVPMALGSFLTGIISSLGTRWGLFRYYWVVVKLLITVLATIILVIHTQPISLLADVSVTTTSFSADLHKLQIQMVAASVAALIVLFVLTALSVYQPRGMTTYGLRKLQEQQRQPKV